MTAQWLLSKGGHLGRFVIVGESGRSYGRVYGDYGEDIRSDVKRESSDVRL